MATIQITSTNYNGQTAQVTFYSVNAPTTPVNLGPQTIPYSRSGNDVYGSYELNFTAYNKTCVVALNGTTTTTTTTAAPTTTTTTTTATPTTTTTAAPIGGIGYTMTGAGNSNYNGTYCLYTDSVNWFDRVYKNSSNMYLYFREGFWWTGPVIGNFYADSDGYYSVGGIGEPPVTPWFAYSCCGTELGNSQISVTQTTCGGA
jgi:hypothetical protein